MKFIQLTLIVLSALFTQGVFASDASTEVEVIFETSKGPFTLKLDPVKAPKTVANFLKYVDEGFYDNTVFHRAIPGFVIQGGGFEKGMKYKKPRAPVKNESANRLKNSRGTISMARRSHPDTATSQFYINLASNTSLDYKSDRQPGYTVFGKITEGMKVIDKIASIPTQTVDNKFKDVPKQDVIVISAKRKSGKATQASKQKQFVAGEHYTVLNKSVTTRDSKKIEVVEMFSYGCPHCYEFESSIKEWSKQQGSDVDFWFFPAVWNKPMNLLARAFYTAQELQIENKVHNPLFAAIAIDHKSIRNENDLADIFAKYGVDKKTFRKAFNSTTVESLAQEAEERVGNYNPVGVPEIVVNGKYRIDRMRAGGLKEMVAVLDFLVNKERAILKK